MLSTLQSAPRKDLSDGQVGIVVSAAEVAVLVVLAEVPLGADGGVLPSKGVQVRVKVSHENGAQQWPVALQSAPREVGLPG